MRHRVASVGLALLLVLLAALLASLAVGVAPAAADYLKWTGGSSNRFDDGGNWANISDPDDQGKAPAADDACEIGQASVVIGAGRAEHVAALFTQGSLSIPSGAILTLGPAVGYGASYLSDLQILNQGTLALRTGAAILDACSIVNSGTIDFQTDDAYLSGASGSISNSGTITKSGGDGYSDIYVPFAANTGEVTATSGTLSLSLYTTGPVGGTYHGDGGTVGLVPHVKAFTLGAGASIEGGVDVPGGWVGEVAIADGATVTFSGANRISGGDLVGPGTALIPAGATMNVEQAGATFAGGLRLDNRGTLALRIFTVLYDTAIVNSGTIDFQTDYGMSMSDADCSISNSGTITKSGGDGYSDIYVPFAANTGTISATSGTLSLTGKLADFDSATGVLSGGTYTAVAPGVVHLSTVALETNAATLVLSGSGAVITDSSGALTEFVGNANAGTLSLENGAALTTTGALSNAGVVGVGSSSTLTVNGAYTQSAGSTGLGATSAKLVSTGPGAAVTNSGGAFTGNGSITPALASAASVSPNGVLTANGFLQAAAGTLTLDIAGTTSGTGYDSLVSSGGAIALDGTLELRTAASYAPKSGDTFSILSGGVVSGTFTKITGLVARPGLLYRIDYAPSSVRLVVIAAKPALTKLSPTKGHIGVTVTLTGANFGAAKGKSTVKFGAKAVTKYVSWSATKIKVKVPKGTAKGKVKVTVKTAAGTSAAKTFNRL